MRTTLARRPRTARGAVAAFAAASTLGLSACGGDTAGTEAGADVEDVTEVEEELGIDLDDALFADYEQENYVVAQDVQVLENVDRAGID